MEKIIELIELIDNDDESVGNLQEAMEYFCGTHDKCEGYKHALIVCLKDQYGNHPEEQEPEDLKKLEEILTK